MKKILLFVFLCFTIPIFSGGLHFGIIDAIKEKKGELKEKIRKGEEFKKWQEERRKELIYAGGFDESSGPKIYIFNNLGEYVNEFGRQGAGDGEFGAPDEIFGNLPDIAIDKEKHLWAIDLPNARIQKFDKDGMFLLKFGEWGTETGKFCYPVGISADNECNIYVLDIYVLETQEKRRVQKFDKYGKFLKKFEFKAEGKYLYIGPIALNRDENIYVIGCLDKYYDEDIFIYKFDQNGNLTAKFGSGKGTGTGQFEEPMDIKIDREENIFVLDSSLCRIQTVTYP